MDPYHHRSQASTVGGQGSGNTSPNGPSQHSYSAPESATSRFRKAFSRRRTGRSGDPEDGTQSDAPSSKRLVPAGGISSLIVKKDPKPALQFATSTFQALGHRMNKQPVPRVASQIGAPPEFVVANVQKAIDEQRARQPSPIPVAVSTSVSSNRKSIHRTSQLVAGPEISAAIEYMLDSPRNSSSSPASSPKPKPVPEPLLSPPSPRALRSASVSNDAAPPLPRPSRDGVDPLKRRSMSLSFIPAFAAGASSSPPQVQAVTVEKDVPPSSYNLSPKFAPSSYGPHSRSQSSVQGPIPSVISSSSLSEAKPYTESSISGYIHPSNTDRNSSATNIRGKLAAWTASSSHTSTQDLTSKTRESPRNGRGSSPNHSKAASMVASIGPAATAATGMAVNLSKRAYERVNSIWTPGSRTSHSNPHSAQSSESSEPNNTSRGSHAHHPSKTRLNYSSFTGYGGSMSDVETTRRRMGVQKNLHGAGSGNGRIDESPVGLSLGTMLRPPFRRLAQGGGLVFGRPLADCVRDTKPLVVVGGHEDGIEARFIPALVLRCVQHIERWGLTEEGLFRIAGRTSHINKLRIEFASGADYDLQECGPGDLDPHAVVSVLKAFLRELPDPILTRSRVHLFENAFEKAKGAGFMLALPSPTSPAALNTPPAFATTHMRLPSNPRVGLPSNPRDGFSPPPPPMQPVHSPQDFLHLQPTPSTQQSQANQTNQVEASNPNEPTVSPQEALSTLLEEFHTLVNSLPRENRDLLLTIIELLKKASSHSKATKMPLSNLLLVLCPSMSMNPGVLKVFVEHVDAIFMEKELPIPVPTPIPDDVPVTATSFMSSVMEPHKEGETMPNIAQEAHSAATGDETVQIRQAAGHHENDGTVATERVVDQSQPPNDLLAVEQLPVRKQSLRRLQQSRSIQISGDTAPSAYTPINIPQDDPLAEATNERPRQQEQSDPLRYATQLQDNLQRQEGVHRSNSSSRSASPATSYEGLRPAQPAGPRLPRSIPAPLTLHSRQGSNSSSQILTPQQAEHARTPPATTNNFSPRIVVFPETNEGKREETTPSSGVQLDAPPSTDSAPQSGEGVTLLVTPSLPEVDNMEPLTSTFVDKRVTHMLQRRTIFASDITPPPSTGSTNPGLSPPPGTAGTIATVATQGSSLGVPTPDTERTMVSQPLTPLLIELQRQNAGHNEGEGQQVDEEGLDYPTVEPLSLQKKAAAAAATSSGASISQTTLSVDPSSNLATNNANSEPTNVEESQQGLRLDKPPGIYSESALSSASSAVTDSTHLFDREMSWPEVPTTIPTVKPGDGYWPNVPAFVNPGPRMVPGDTAPLSNNGAGGSRRPLPLPPQVHPAAASAVFHGQPPPQLPMPNKLSPMGNDMITIDVSKEAPLSSPQANETLDSAEEYERDDSLSNLTTRPGASRAPRLTVNSKDMINGDSYWAKELQRVLRSASPSSPVEHEREHDVTRYSGEWAPSVLNAAGS